MSSLRCRTQRPLRSTVARKCKNDPWHAAPELVSSGTRMDSEFARAVAATESGPPSGTRSTTGIALTGPRWGTGTGIAPATATGTATALTECPTAAITTGPLRWLSSRGRRRTGLALLTAAVIRGLVEVAVPARVRRPDQVPVLHRLVVQGGRRVLPRVVGPAPRSRAPRSHGAVVRSAPLR
jgi:hypothetical protein